MLLLSDQDYSLLEYKAGKLKGRGFGEYILQQLFVLTSQDWEDM